MADISLRHIEIFHAVMTTGNLTEAAALLNTSQPTVSRELARFEHLVQMPLFERLRGRLHPTAQALQLFDEVQHSYYGLDRIINAARDIRQFRQAPLSVACLPVFSQSLLPEVCQPLLARYPALNLHVIPQESPLLEEWLSAQRHDLGLTENLNTPAGTERQTLMELNEVCVLPIGHPLARKAVLTPEDFRDQPFVSLSSTDSYRQLLDQQFEQANVTRRLVLDTHSAASVCAMVRAGVGLSIVNPLTAVDYAGSGAVAVRRFSIEVPFTVSLIRPLHRPASSLVEQFTEQLLAFAERFPARLQHWLAHDPV
ncbi:LysR family transcriptional regulator [Dickeya fangzhongdai]|uniref:LysR family transcriptional regulator n=1 Tax=Dickeya fangzhongdai TaxID=1778540 RepID=UPI002B30C078|nr:LysR family transcriptional regulator [Dickeya fangzhongdai]